MSTPTAQCQTWLPERLVARTGEATASPARRVVSAQELAVVRRFLQHNDGAAAAAPIFADRSWFLGMSAAIAFCSNSGCLIHMVL
jgi:hypothetical protein